MAKQKIKADYIAEAEALGIKVHGLTVNELKAEIKAATPSSSSSSSSSSSKLVYIDKSGDFVGMFTTHNKREVLKQGYVKKQIFEALQDAINKKDFKAAINTGIVRKVGIIKRLIENVK